MPSQTPDSRIRLTGTAPREERPFDLRPETEARAALAERLGISAVRKLRLEGSLTPAGHRDWELDATLGATVVQPCGVTLEPVTTRIDVPVSRLYRADWSAPETAEQEMPEDTDDEPMPPVLDLMDLLEEELSLAIPPFPRAEGAEDVEAEAIPPGAEPIEEETHNPFAGLRDALKGD